MPNEGQAEGRGLAVPARDAAYEHGSFGLLRLRLRVKVRDAVIARDQSGRCAQLDGPLETEGEAGVLEEEWVMGVYGVVQAPLPSEMGQNGLVLLLAELALHPGLGQWSRLKGLFGHCWLRYCLQQLSYWQRKTCCHRHDWLLHHGMCRPHQVRR